MFEFRGKCRQVRQPKYFFNVYTLPELKDYRDLSCPEVERIENRKTITGSYYRFQFYYVLHETEFTKKK